MRFNLKYAIIVIVITLIIFGTIRSILLAEKIIPGTEVNPKELEKKYPSKLKRLELKPDLIIENIDVQRLAQDPPNTTPSRIKARITVIVKNRNIPSLTENSLTREGQQRQCQGAFKVLVEWTDNPSSGYNYLCVAGIDKLAGGESKTFFCDYWFSYGSSVKIKATVDNLNWIDESDENNNSLLIGYLAR
mgnify:CR=1 FL=1